MKPARKDGPEDTYVEIRINGDRHKVTPKLPLGTPQLAIVCGFKSEKDVVATWSLSGSRPHRINERGVIPQWGTAITVSARRDDRSAA